MSVHPLAGKPAPESCSSMSMPFDGPITNASPISPTEPNRSASARAVTADRHFGARSTRRTSSPSPRRSAHTARARASAVRCYIGKDTHALSAGVHERPRGARGEWRRCNDRRRRCLHPDARRVPRDPRVQPETNVGARRRDRDHAVAQSAGGRRLQVQPAHGGPADTDVTRWIEDEANRLLSRHLDGVARLSYTQARQAPTTHVFDYRGTYVDDLASVVDMEAIRSAGLKIGVDPLGGAGVGYWQPIAERYGLDVTVVNSTVDPTFRFMSLDWDGKIRMDCSSPYAMATLIGLKDRFDLAFGNDADNDRHGIVTPTAGLMNPNHVLAAAIFYLFTNRPDWRGMRRSARPRSAAASSIEWPAKSAGGSSRYRSGSNGSCRDCSTVRWALAVRRAPAHRFCDGTARLGDRQGRIRHGSDRRGADGADRSRPCEVYGDLTRELGAPGTSASMRRPRPSRRRGFSRSRRRIHRFELAGDPIEAILTTAPGNGAAIGGLKVGTGFGWFAARPSGTEDVYKLYAESFRGLDHLRRIQEEAQALLTRTLTARRGA